MRQMAWTGTGWVLLGILGVLGILGAQEPVKVTAEARQKGLFSQFTSRTQWQMPTRVMDEIGLKPGMTVFNRLRWWRFIGRREAPFPFALRPSPFCVVAGIDTVVRQKVKSRHDQARRFIGMINNQGGPGE